MRWKPPERCKPVTLLECGNRPRQLPREKNIVNKHMVSDAVTCTAFFHPLIDPKRGKRQASLPFPGAQASSAKDDRCIVLVRMARLDCWSHPPPSPPWSPNRWGRARLCSILGPHRSENGRMGSARRPREAKHMRGRTAGPSRAKQTPRPKGRSPSSLSSACRPDLREIQGSDLVGQPPHCEKDLGCADDAAGLYHQLTDLR